MIWSGEWWQSQTVLTIAQGQDKSNGHTQWNIYFLSEHQKILVISWLVPIICYRWGIKVNSQSHVKTLSDNGTCPEHLCSTDCLEILRFANLAWPAGKSNASSSHQCTWKKNRREHSGMLALNFSAFWCLGPDLYNLLPSDNYCPEVRPTKINKPSTRSYDFIYSLSWMPSFTIQDNQFHKMSMLLSYSCFTQLYFETNM